MYTFIIKNLNYKNERFWRASIDKYAYMRITGATVGEIDVLS